MNPEAPVEFSILSEEGEGNRSWDSNIEFPSMEASKI